MENEKTVNFWLSSDDEKRDAYFKIKEKLNVSPKAAEKDWWVSHVIKAVFSLDCAEALTFKGGTSLSKAWGITQRFSEDVDISIDKSFFGLSGDTRSSRDRIRKLSRKYIQEVVRDELRGLVYVYGGDKYEVNFKVRQDSDADPTVLLVPYYSVLPADPYIKEVVRIVFSCRNLREPRELRSIVPFAAQFPPAPFWKRSSCSTKSSRKTTPALAGCPAISMTSIAWMPQATPKRRLPTRISTAL